jgi:tRNA-Thr(GGU) m(6)t(6)A37 methyltransferase TsaA
MELGNQILLRPVGVFRTDATDDEIRERAGELEATVEVLSEFREALDGLEGFSHIFVLSYLHKLRPDQIGPLKVRPRRLLKAGLKFGELSLVGVFAIDSPTRPNPIGLSLVRLLRTEKTRLLVRGLDLFDGTPVLDLKPYRSNCRAEDYELPGWYRRILERVGADI